MVKCQHGCRKWGSVSDHKQTFKFFIRQMHKENMWLILGRILLLFDKSYFVNCRVRCWRVVRCFKSNLISSDRISLIYQISTILHVSSQICWCSIWADVTMKEGFLLLWSLKDIWNNSKYGDLNPESQRKSRVLLTWNTDINYLTWIISD